LWNDDDNVKNKLDQDDGGNASDSDDVIVQVGDVGYKFRKHFEGHGWYQGEVVQILKGPREYYLLFVLWISQLLSVAALVDTALAGSKDRRCYYEDGEWEDNTLEEMQRLAILDTKTGTKKQCDDEPKKKKAKKERTKKKNKKKRDIAHAIELDQKPAAKGEVASVKSDVELDTKPAGEESPVPPIVTRATAKRQKIDVSNS